MPEGPSIVILKELLMPYKGKTVLSATGSAKIDLSLLVNKKIIDFKSHGKHFLICFKGFYIRIHLLMFGTYRINERKAIAPRLSLTFKKDEINFYTCSVQLFENDVNENYDWGTDVMSDQWDPKKAEKTIKQLPEELVADLLLNQELFAGVGNIIKNEVLFRIKVHPKTQAGALPSKKLKELVKEASHYSFDFYNWKKEYTLKKHWLIYFKRICPRCKVPVEKEYLGKGKRITYFCNSCQVLY
jgi:endonuclease-8